MESSFDLSRQVKRSYELASALNMLLGVFDVYDENSTALYVNGDNEMLKELYRSIPAPNKISQVNQTEYIMALNSYCHAFRIILTYAHIENQDHETLTEFLDKLSAQIEEMKQVS